MIQKTSTLPSSVNISINNVKKEVSTNDSKITKDKERAKEIDTKEVIVVNTKKVLVCPNKTFTC